MLPTIQPDDHPCGWLAPGDLGCHELQRAILLFKMSLVPDARRIPCQVCVISLNFRVPWCDMRRGDRPFLPCRVNAPACAFQPWPGAAALQHLQQPMGVAKPQLKQGLHTSVTSPSFTMDLFAEPPPFSEQTDSRYQKLDGDQSSWAHPASALCLTKALMVPATERNAS